MINMTLDIVVAIDYNNYHHNDCQLDDSCLDCNCYKIVFYYFIIVGWYNNDYYGIIIMIGSILYQISINVNVTK
jgi:hypothetical protein